MINIAKTVIYIQNYIKSDFKKDESELIHILQLNFELPFEIVKPEDQEDYLIDFLIALYDGIFDDLIKKKKTTSTNNVIK